MSRPKKSRQRYNRPVPPQPSITHADGSTSNPEYPALEGREPLPEEITGKASGTSDDLVTLFDSTDREHMADGFRGGSEDDTDVSPG